MNSKTDEAPPNTTAYEGPLVSTINVYKRLLTGIEGGRQAKSLNRVPRALEGLPCHPHIALTPMGIKARCPWPVLQIC